MGAEKVFGGMGNQDNQEAGEEERLDEVRGCKYVTCCPSRHTRNRALSHQGDQSWWLLSLASLGSSIVLIGFSPCIWYPL